MSDIVAAGDAPRLSPIRAVVDTSALVPARLRRDLQQAAQIGAFVGIRSPWIIAELNRVLVWRWIKDAPPDRTPNDLGVEAGLHTCLDLRPDLNARDIAREGLALGYGGLDRDEILQGARILRDVIAAAAGGTTGVAARSDGAP